MRRQAVDCDYTGEKNLTNPIELQFEVDSQMDASGNGRNYIYEYLYISPEAAKIILNGLITEMSQNQQRSLFNKIKNKEKPHRMYGFGVLT